MSSTSSRPRPISRRAVQAAQAALAAGLLALAGPSWALYKVLGPDGKVIGYTDRPPLEGRAVTMKSNGATVPTDSLPYELRQVAQRYPVTLYTSKNCAPCEGARSALSRRGIPFREFTIETETDAKQLRQQEGTDSLPIVRIGAQRLTGYNESDLTSYLDAAGYPKTSQLPSSYKQPAPSPLTPPAAASAPPKPRDTPPPAPPKPEGGTTLPGFKF